MHISCVRGSPLIRTILILAVLVASGILFVRLTATPEIEVPQEGVKRQPNQPIEVVNARVYVTLSGVAKTLDLFANAGYYRFGQSETASYSGDDLKIAKDNPVLQIKVDWAEDSTARRFAKVVIEADGKKTFTHVFDSPGDIDDFVELPF
jgi:hypothetical protein